MRYFIRLLAGVLIVAALTVKPGEGSQIFVLDFDSGGGGTSGHSYTPAERDQITSEMNAQFAKLGMSATQVPPASGPFSTVTFNAASAGTASVDLRNADKEDGALVNANLMLEILGVPPAQITSEKIVRTSINIGMHEALHLVGARHQDSFTLPGQGVSSSSLRDNFDPPYLGPFVADLSPRTFMSLTTLLGISEEKLALDDFFISPRTALKAVVGEEVSPIAQLSGINSPFTPQPIIPTRFNLPNTLPADLPLPPELADILPPGTTADQVPLFAEAVVVTGTITQAEIDDDDISPSHYYAVPIIPGAPYTIEVFSDVLGHRSGFTSFDTALTVIIRDPATGGPALHPYYGTPGNPNRDGWEGIDPAMVDLIAPSGPSAFEFEGVPFMIVEVWSQSGFGQEPEAGDYELIIYTIGVVPEPATLALLGIGSISLVGSGRRRRRHAPPQLRHTRNLNRRHHQRR